MYDALGRLEYNHHRYYDPQIGYTQADPRGILLDYSDPQRQVAAQMGIPIYPNAVGPLNHSYAYANQNPLRYSDPTGEAALNTATGAGAGFAIGGPPGAVVGAAVGTVAFIGSAAWAAWSVHQAVNDNSNNGPIPIDPSRPIPPQLPGYVDPSSTFPGTEAEHCPPMGGSPIPPRERCANGVQLQFAACLRSGRNPQWCQIKRLIGLLACAAKSPDSDGS